MIRAVEQALAADSSVNGLYSKLRGRATEAHRSALKLEYILTTPFKYLVRGLIINVVVLFFLSLYLLVSIALSYKGRCGVFYFFGGQGRPCPFLEYLREELAFTLIVLLGYFWWLILLLFLVIPGIGYLIGRRRNSLNLTR
jgi:hypothetical protein